MELDESISRLAAARRILVLGSSGAGKTTFSIKLADRLDLPLIFLDLCFWQPGWVSTPQSVWRAEVALLIQKDAWVMDGTYENSLDLRIPASEGIILFEIPRWKCLWRVIKRRLLIDEACRRDAPAGQKLDGPFLRYIWQYPYRTRPKVDESIRRYGPDKVVITIRTDREAEELLQRLGEMAIGAQRSTADTVTS